MQKYPKEEKVLRQILGWEKKHLRSRTKVNYALTADLLKHDGLNTDFRRYLVTKEYSYRSDTSRTFDLGPYGETVLGWAKRACRQIEVFHERHALRSRLDKELREDGLYEKMEQVFYAIMAQYLHVVSFFQYDRILNAAYRDAGVRTVARILDRADQLLEYYGSYLSLQGASAFTEPFDEISGIQVAVEAMQDALRQTHDTDD
ncbi:MAG: hypothetical protein IKI77_12115 [Oscillospiraceae bacterium]|nr:hypothetical protein [Oscillospiraceae bacterium]